MTGNGEGLLLPEDTAFAWRLVSKGGGLAVVCAEFEALHVVRLTRKWDQVI